jgi:hypothetical protein
MAKGQHGGKRPGGGRKLGTILQKTRDKAIAREALRAIIDKHMEAMTEAQIKNAQGINYLVKRAKVGGKFEKVNAEDLDAALQGQNDGTLILEIWAERPNVQSYTDLMNRHLDKPTEHHDVTAELTVKGYKWQD